MSKNSEILTDIEIEFKDSLKSINKKVKHANSKDEINIEYNKLLNIFLNKDSKLLKILKKLKKIKDIDEKRLIGKKANELREKITNEIKNSQKQTIIKFIENQTKQEKIDPTKPGILPKQFAHQNIVTQTIEKIEDIFISMGFGVEYSYEIDSAYNAFDTVNIPEDHPARDNWDTLWMEDNNLAIPHTSAMQNRILKNNNIPIKKIIIGKCFRNEATDATHEHTFYQMEGIYLDKNVSMGDMIGVLLEFLQNYFNSQFKYKFIPDFFPFVEPGGQIAIEKSAITHEKSQSEEYLEILGCGMIHPDVIKKAGKDPDIYNGFAWGVGIERLILLKYDISDIRLFYSGDLNFIKQF